MIDRTLWKRALRERAVSTLALWTVAVWTLAVWTTCGAEAVAQEQDWSRSQIGKLPAEEKPVQLFNGKDLTGWEGQTEKYFRVENGIIVARNSAENAPPASTYLVTNKPYRNFRLIFESKLVTSEMHSGIALWGKTVEKMGDKFSYQGHLVMYPSGYGYYDLYRRNSIYQDKEGKAKKAGRQHDWNQMEILAIGSRIRHVINGQLVADWTDPQPELCGSGPIGLQLHSNKVAQEVHFRGLVLTENPQDVLVTATGDTKAAAAAEKTTLAQIPAKMQEFVNDGKFSGAVTLVAHQGKVVHLAAVGVADVDTKRPMKTDSLFAIASMTKPITATAVLMLVEQGKLQLDDPITKYLPEFQTTKLNGETPTVPIAVRHLLTHTSGIVGDQANIGTLAETSVKMAERPLAFEAGTKWQYGPGLSIAGRVVEVVSGQPFEKFLAERLFQPLKMNDTTWVLTEDQQKNRLAKLYKPGSTPGSLAPGEHFLLDFSKPRTPNPSGGLFSTASDLARFYQMLLNGGELDGVRYLSAASIQEMTRNQTGNLQAGFTPGSVWGLGFGITRDPQGATEDLSPGSFGHGGAFGTQGWIDPTRKTIYVLLIQRTGFGNGDASDPRRVFQHTARHALP